MKYIHFLSCVTDYVELMNAGSIQICGCHGSAPAAAVKEPKKEEPAEESDDDIGYGSLFDSIM